MKKLPRSLAVACVLCCLMGSGCQSTGAPAASSSPPAGPAGITYSGGDGSSCERVVVISGAKNERAGIAAEYSWVRAHFPGYRRTQQDLSQCGDKPADILHLEDGAGHKADVYFDISGFFGKM
jgi:hypothetical protein